MTAQTGQSAGKSIKIVGGGIGGLAAGLALAQRGAAVTVYEKAGGIAEVGAGLQVSPNGMCVLDALGAGAAVRAKAVAGEAVSLRAAETGKEVAHLALDAGAYSFVHRADLVDALATAARAAGVQIRPMHTAAHITPAAAPQITFASGEEATADVVIDAGGLHSTLRGVLNPASEPFFTGQVAWRALVPNTGGRGAQVQVHMAPGAHVVSYPLRGGALLNIVAVQERAAWADEGWSHEDDPANLRAAFAGAGPEVTALLAQVQRVHLWGLFRHPVASVWTGANCALLGDAAHPTLPFLAQGANMALEDAWALAACLDAIENTSAALKRYQQLRLARVQRVIKTANGNAKRYHLRKGPVRFAAHLGLRVVSTAMPALMTAPFRWLYEYDITKVEP